MKEERTVEIPDSILGVKISAKQKEVLTSGKETALIKGFTNKEGHKFDAFLSLNAENKLVFRFENPEEQGKDEYKAYKTEINLAGFARHFGFEFEAGFSPDAQDLFEYVILRNKDQSGIIVYRDLNTMEYRFFQASQPKNAGTLIDFLHLFKSLTKNEIQDEIQKNKAFGSISNESIKFVPVEGNYEDAFLKIRQLQPLNKRDLLQDSFVKDSTPEHAFFRGKIFNQTSGKSDKSICFPLFRFEQYAGVYCTSAFEDPIAEQHDGIWFSNIINDQKIRRLIIFDNPLDALSYHQLYSKPSDLFTLYLATCGLSYSRQIAEVQHIIDKYKPEQILLANIRTAGGHMRTISLLGQLSESRKFIDKVDAWQDENSEIRFEITGKAERNHSAVAMTVKLNYPDLEKGIFMNENLLKYFEQINLKELKDHPEWEDMQPFKTTIQTIGRHSSIAEIVFPYKSDFLQIAEKIVQHLRPILFLKTEHSQSVSYREDLRSMNENKLASKESRTRKLG